ncbi:MAG: hypothetical protein KGI19_07410, partial [Thaumarchaeota archaeon]|nr:hypothetical protein [Nitrososphaerota archaeon]
MSKQASVAIFLILVLASSPITISNSYSYSTTSDTNYQKHTINFDSSKVLKPSKHYQISVNDDISKDLSIGPGSSNPSDESPKSIKGVYRSIDVSDNMKLTDENPSKNKIMIVKQIPPVQAIMERISNSERQKFFGKQTSTSTYQIRSQLSDYYTSKSLSGSFVQSATNEFTSDKITDDQSILYKNPVESIFEDYTFSNEIHLIIFDLENSLTLLLIVPFAGYLLVRVTDGRFRIKPKSIFSFCFIILLVVSSITTPFSISSNYWGQAFAQEYNGTTNGVGFSLSNQTTNSVINSSIVNSSMANFSTMTHLPKDILNSDQLGMMDSVNVFSNHIQSKTSSLNFTALSQIGISDYVSILLSTPNGTRLFSSQNKTSNIQIAAVNGTISTRTSSFSDQVEVSDRVVLNATSTIPVPTKSWNFNSTTSTVGDTRIVNETSLKLDGSGYVAEKVNQTNTINHLTISAWVNPDYTHGSPVFTVISKENQFILSINNNIQPKMIAQFSIFDGIKWDTVNSTIPIQNWTHLAATYNGSAISIYVNGTLQSTDLLQGVLSLSESGILQLKTPDQITSNSDVVIGGSFNSVRQSVNNEFSGLIKNVKIYDSLLTPSQISQIYSQNNNVSPVAINTLVNPSLAENVNITDSVILSLNSTNSTVNSLNDTSLTVVPSINKTKNNYLSTEDPEFVFQYFSNDQVAKMAKQIKLHQKKPQYGKWQEQDKSISIEVYDPSGNKTSLKSEFTELSQGKFDIKLHTGRDVKPGLYKVKITMTRQGKSFTVTDQYTWGLVSVNTLRSIYLPGEKANFEIVVLDNNGHPVCNSDIIMSITDPESKITILSSGNGISTSNDCGLYNADYVPTNQGNYTVNVVAKTPDGISSFDTYFLTMANFDFNIVRMAASKIDPVNNPNSFNVTINVESFVNSSPVTISESVPSVFNVVTDASVATIGDSKILTWNKDLVGNKTSLQYSYSVPLQFPRLYTLGPVKITYGNNQTFTEARPWFVANDPAFTPTASDIIQLTESATVSSHQFHAISTSDTISLSEKTSTSIPVEEILQLSEKTSTSIPVKEVLSLSDSASSSNNQFRPITASDTLALSDSAISNAGRLLSPSDTVALSDSASSSNNQFRPITASDTLALSD